VEAARVLGLTIPQSLLLRADALIRLSPAMVPVRTFRMCVNRVAGMGAMLFNARDPVASRAGI